MRSTPPAVELRPRTDLRMLDALRGLAALYVVVYHARVLLWSGYATNIPGNARSATVWAGYPEYVASAPAGLERIVAALSALANFGTEAVILFFVLSGFCIHYRQAATARAGSGSRFDIRAYARRRLRRLYPPLMAGLALTVLFDALGSQMNAEVYTGATQYGMLNANLSGGDHYSAATTIGTLLMQGGLLTLSFGSNGVVQSLAFEFWFYVLYPVVLLVTARRNASKLIPFALAGSFIGLSLWLLGFIPPRVVIVFFCWLVWAAGAWIAEAYVGRVRAARLGPLALAGAVLLMVLVALPATHPELAALTSAGTATGAPLWGAALAPLLAYLMVDLPERFRRAAESAAKRLVGLGSISYSLYLVHYPLMLFIASWWLMTHATLPDGPLLAMSGIALALGLGTVSWYLVERRFVSPRGTRGRLRTEPSLAVATAPIA